MTTLYIRFINLFWPSRKCTSIRDVQDARVSISNVFPRHAQDESKESRKPKAYLTSQYYTENECYRVLYIVIDRPKVPPHASIGTCFATATESAGTSSIALTNFINRPAGIYRQTEPPIISMQVAKVKTPKHCYSAWQVPRTR